MRKVLVSYLILCFLIVLFSGCGEKSKELSGKDYSRADCELSQEPLRVLVDFDYAEQYLLSVEIDKVLSSVTVDSTDVEGLRRIIWEKGGFSVKFEFPPDHGNERDTYLTNLRVEIMGGAGPDVFLCAASPSIYLDYNNIVDNMAQIETVMPVFQFPDKAIRNRVFLPLNDRIENAQFMEFDQLNQLVMDAGKYEGEQYLMPTGYTVPVLCYPKSAFSFDCPKDMTWQEMGQAGPELAYTSATLAPSLYCGYMFNPFMDYEKDEPAFSEEKLLGLMKDIKKRNESMDTQTLPAYFSGWLSMGFSDVAKDKDYLEYKGLDLETFDLEEGLTMVPVYSVEGGYSATVTSFAAINANTQQPDEAFFFLDYWMSEECQRSPAWGYFNWQQAVPTMEGLLAPEKPCLYLSGLDEKGQAEFSGWSMTDGVYEDFRRVRDNISNARFATPIDMEMRNLMGEAVYGEGNPDVEKLTHEAYMRMKMIAAES